MNFATPIGRISLSKSTVHTRYKSSQTQQFIAQTIFLIVVFDWIYTLYELDKPVPVAARSKS